MNDMTVDNTNRVMRVQFQARHIFVNLIAKLRHKCALKRLNHQIKSLNR